MTETYEEKNKNGEMVVEEPGCACHKQIVARGGVTAAGQRCGKVIKQQNESRSNTWRRKHIQKKMRFEGTEEEEGVLNLETSQA